MTLRHTYPLSSGRSSSQPARLPPLASGHGANPRAICRQPYQQTKAKPNIDPPPNNSALTTGFFFLQSTTVRPCYNGACCIGNLIVPMALASQPHLAMTDKTSSATARSDCISTPYMQQQGLPSCRITCRPRCGCNISSGYVSGRLPIDSIRQVALQLYSTRRTG